MLFLLLQWFVVVVDDGIVPIRKSNTDGQSWESNNLRFHRKGDYLVVAKLTSDKEQTRPRVGWRFSARATKVTFLKQNKLERTRRLLPLY